MKKFLSAVACSLLLIPCVFLFSACGKPSLGNKDWESVGLSSDTISLPNLRVEAVTKVNTNQEVAVSILWNDGSLEAFDALALECFTKIPANKTFDDTVETDIDALIESNLQAKKFSAVYTVDGQKFFCTVNYFLEDASVMGMVYRKNQILLGFSKEIKVNISHEFWELDSQDHSWFTTEELQEFGLVGLQAPQGNVIGKLAEDSTSRKNIYLSLENITREGFQNFCRKLYDDHGANLGFMNREVPFEELFIDTGFTELFEANYQFGSVTGKLVITFGSEHMLIRVSVDKV